MLNKKLGLLFLAIIQVVVADTKDDLGKAWKPDFSAWSFDPSSWNDTVKDRMYKVGMGAAFAAYMGSPLPVVAGFAFLLFGLVNLSWGLLSSSCLALYGWRRTNRNFLFVGLAVSYLLAFGVSLSLS